MPWTHNFPPDGIILTLSAACIKDNGGYREMVKDFLRCRSDVEQPEFMRMYWMRLPVKPIHQVMYVYIVMHNKIRWRANIVELHGEGYKEFSGNRVLKAKCWMVVCDFEPMPRPLIERRGFRGFRYTEKLH